MNKRRTRTKISRPTAQAIILFASISVNEPTTGHVMYIDESREFTSTSLVHVKVNLTKSDIATRNLEKLFNC